MTTEDRKIDIQVTEPRKTKKQIISFLIYIWIFNIFGSLILLHASLNPFDQLGLAASICVILISITALDYIYKKEK